MEGLSRQGVPPVERSFVSSRLAEDLLSSVYERLVETERRPERLADQGRSLDTADWENESTEQEAMEILVTGGRS